MTRIMMIVVVSIYLLLMSTASMAHEAIANSPIGLWKTIDDVTGQPKAIIEITEAPNKTLSGRILKTYPTPGEQPQILCTACQGKRHNQRIVGMQILEDLKQNKDNTKSWGGGQILDPKNGKTYHCTILLNDTNDRLRVRGYIGLPLFGRTQTWIRVNSASI